MEYTVSEVIPNQAITASTAITPVELGVQGISYLWLSIAALQNAAATPVTPDNLLAVLDNVTVSFNGQALWSGRALELARMGMIIAKMPMWMTHAADAANADVTLSFVIPFGRGLLNPKEGLMAAKRGELLFQATGVAAFTNLVTPRIMVQQVEVPGNQFQRYNKVTTRSTTPAATGNLDVPAPIGNLLRGLLVFQTTRYRNVNTPGGMRSILLRVNNGERYVTGGQIGHQMHLAMARGRYGANLDGAARVENTAAAYTQNASTRQEAINTLEFMRQYAFMDLDPTEDDTYTLDTKGLSQLETRIDMAIAENTRLAYYESVAIGAAGGGR